MIGLKMYGYFIDGVACVNKEDVIKKMRIVEY